MIGQDMKRSRAIFTLVTLPLFLGLFSAQTSQAILPADTYGSTSSSETSNESNIFYRIGHVLERVASTVSQIVSPQPPESKAAQLAYQPIPKIVCVTSTIYVTSFVPITTWTLAGSRYIPIVTGTIISMPIEKKICS